MALSLREASSAETCTLRNDPSFNDICNSLYSFSNQKGMLHPAVSLAQRLFYSRLSNVEPLATDDGDVGRKLVKKKAVEG